MTLAQLAYEAYRAHTGGISLASGQPIPEWNALKPEIQELPLSQPQQLFDTRLLLNIHMRNIYY